MKSASCEYRKMSTRSGAQFVPIGMPTVCWKTFPAKTTKILSTRNSTPILPKSRHTLKMMVSGIFVEFEITVNQINDIILNTATMRT